MIFFLICYLCYAIAGKRKKEKEGLACMIDLLFSPLGKGRNVRFIFLRNILDFVCLCVCLSNQPC